MSLQRGARQGADDLPAARDAPDVVDVYALKETRQQGLGLLLTHEAAGGL